MALVKKIRAAQVPLVAEFVVNLTDTMVNTSAAAVAFGASGTNVFDIFDPTPGMQVIGGDIVCETAVTGSTELTAALGDSASAARYVAATSVNAAGERAAVVPTGYTGQGEAVRLTIVATGAATAGKLRVRLLYVIDGRANENM